MLRAGDGAVGGHLERACRYRTELGLLDDRTGRLRGRAAAALGRAGAQAVSRSDLAWADDLLERAVELDPDDAGSVRRLGEVRVALGRTASGARLLRRVAELDSASVESAHARLALAVLDPSGPGPGLTATARAVLPVFEAAGDAVGRARSHLRLAQHLQQAGFYTRRRNVTRRAPWSRRSWPGPNRNGPQRSAPSASPCGAVRCPRPRRWPAAWGCWPRTGRAARRSGSR